MLALLAAVAAVLCTAHAQNASIAADNDNLILAVPENKTILFHLGDAAVSLSDLVLAGDLTAALTVVDASLDAVEDKFGTYYKKGEVDAAVAAVDARFATVYNATEVDAAIAAIDLGYSNAEIDGLLRLQDQTIASLHYTKTEVDQKLAPLASTTDVADAVALLAAKVYTKAEVDTLLTGVYTKTEIDSTLAGYYTRNQVDAGLATKYSKAEVDALVATLYTKAQVDSMLASQTSLINALKATVTGLSAKQTAMINCGKAGKLYDDTQKLCVGVSELTLGSCAEATSSGLYTIRGINAVSKLKVWCEVDGNVKWTVFQRRTSAAVDFYRTYTEYRNGFGSLDSDGWLGLDAMHTLLGGSNKVLRVDLEDSNGAKAYAQYSSFNVGTPGSGYRLTAGGFSGNAGDSLGGHNGAAFSTKDSGPSQGCSHAYKGGWWYTSCHSSNLNGVFYGGTHTSYADGVNWYHWKGYYNSLKSVMRFRN